MANNFLNVKQKVRSLWETTMKSQPEEIQVQRDENDKIIVNFSKLKPDSRMFNKLNKLVFGPIPLQVFPIGSPDLESLAFVDRFEMVFESIDIRALPLIKTELIYTNPAGPNNEGQFAIGDGTSVPSLSLRVQKCFQIEETSPTSPFGFGSEDDDDNRKRVTMRVGLVTRHPTLGIPGGVEVSLLVLFSNPLDLI